MNTHRPLAASTAPAVQGAARQADRHGAGGAAKVRSPASQAGTTRRSDFRARGHAAYWAFVVHRVSGLLLALFLPLHFWVLAQALHGRAAFDRWIALANLPLVEFAEWGLVVLLSLHLVGGLRLLLIEFGPWSGLRKNWIAGAAGFSVATGMAFALALVG